MINKYIGIPWVQGGHSLQGADCWGIVLMVLDEIYGVKVDKYEGAKAEGVELTEIISYEMQYGEWEECEPSDGAVVVMYDRITKRPEHVGVCLVVDGAFMVLHSVSCKPNGSSSITPLPAIQRIFEEVRFFKHASHNN